METLGTILVIAVVVFAGLLGEREAHGFTLPVEEHVEINDQNWKLMPLLMLLGIVAVVVVFAF